MIQEKPTYVNAGPAFDQAGLVHRVLEPAGDGPHPTVVMAHGRSGNEEVMWIFARALPSEWLMVSPRAPLVDFRGGYSWDVRPEGEWPTVDDLQHGSQALINFIAALPALYNADPDNLYLMGFSQGAAINFAATMSGAIRPKAIAALVGFMPLQASPAKLAAFRDVSVHMAVGRRDERIPLGSAESCGHQLIKGGARLDYRAYDTGHRLNARGMNDLVAWWRHIAADQR